MLAKIQVLMLQNDILELQNNPNYSLDNSNSVYVIFTATKAGGFAAGAAGSGLGNIGGRLRGK